MKRIVCSIIALSMAATLLFSLTGCGFGGVQVRSVEVQNSTFFEEMYREAIHNDMELDKDGKNYQLGLAFTNGDADEFKRQFVWRYDAHLGMALILEVKNNTKDAITATGLQVNNNGYKATYVPSCLGYCEDVTIQPGETKQFTVYFLGNGGVYTNEEFINKIFPEMPMELEYTNNTGEQLRKEIRFKKVDAE